MHILLASSEPEINFAFAVAAQRRSGALIVASDVFFDSRREQLITLAKSHAILTIYRNREFVAAGDGLDAHVALPPPDAERGCAAGLTSPHLPPSQTSEARTCRP